MQATMSFSNLASALLSAVFVLERNSGRRRRQPLLVQLLALRQRLRTLHDFAQALRAFGGMSRARHHRLRPLVHALRRRFGAAVAVRRHLLAALAAHGDGDGSGRDAGHLVARAQAALVRHGRVPGLRAAREGSDGVRAPSNGERSAAARVADAERAATLPQQLAAKLCRCMQLADAQTAGVQGFLRT